jgi:hypothetical protein
MAQPMMWNQFQSNYRGQSTNGTIVTVDESVMTLALKKAGKSVFDSDWWLETLERVLNHWGVDARHWIDATTNTRRAHFSMAEETAARK